MNKLVVLLILGWLPLILTYGSIYKARIQSLEDLNNENPEVVGGGKHECYRNCIKGERRECNYRFFVTEYTSMSFTCGKCPLILEDCYSYACITAGGNTRPVAVANHMVPGPSIQASYLSEV